MGRGQPCGGRGAYALLSPSAAMALPSCGGSTDSSVRVKSPTYSWRRLSDLDPSARDADGAADGADAEVEPLSEDALSRVGAERSGVAAGASVTASVEMGPTWSSASSSPPSSQLSSPSPSLPRTPGVEDISARAESIWLGGADCEERRRERMLATVFSAFTWRGEGVAREEGSLVC